MEFDSGKPLGTLCYAPLRLYNKGTLGHNIVTKKLFMFFTIYIIDLPVVIYYLSSQSMNKTMMSFQFYARMLARRLIYAQSMSMDAEEAMINRLKV